MGYSETTGLQYGVTAFRTFQPVDGTGRSATDAIYIARTARGHTKAYLQVDRWSAEGRSQVRVRAEHLSYPLPFFGIGASAPDSAEEWYSNGVSTLHLHMQQRLRDGLYLHADARLLHTRQRDVEAGGALAAGLVTGTAGGRVSELRLGITQDTRDVVTTPRQGTWVRIHASVAASALGSRYAFRRLTFDARRYARMGAGYTAAAQLQVDATTGSVPFDQLPMIGADSAMRGYHRGRYRDRNAATAQLELRSPYWRRAAFVVFAGGGTVARTLGGLPPSRWHPSVGAGLRLRLRTNDRTTARLDLGVGRGTFGASVGLGEAF